MDFNLKQEFNRKLIHLSSSIYPILYMFFSKEIMIAITLVLFLAVFLWDLLRIKGFEFKILLFLNKFLRKKELKRFVGATFFLASMFLVILLFPKDIAILSMFILIFCDTSAALVGKTFGKLKIKALDKSLEGFLAFNIVGFIIVSIYLNITYEIIGYNLYLLSFLAVFIAGVAELFSNKLKIDDNFFITLAFATSLYVFL